MGGRGSRSASGGRVSVMSMTDEQLSRALDRVDKEMESLSKIMQATASDAIGFNQGIPGSSQSKADEYRATQKKYQALQGGRTKIINEQARRKQGSGSAEPRRKFVNSFGEATTRSITSSTYERAMKRLDKQVLRNMGY